jgi:hypothetical protein
MRKGVIVSLVLIAGLIIVSAVYAHFPGGGFGACLSQFENIDIETVKKFQKEILPMRDEMITKRLELNKEYSKENPDRDRIATLQKEIIDIRTKILKKSDEAGLPAWKNSRKSYGMIERGNTSRECPRLSGM